MTTTKKHTQGKLVTIGSTKPGDLIYLRPDHKKYDPSEFAIVVRNGTLLTVKIDPNDRRVFELFEANYCVEIVAQQLAADCCSMTRREVAKAVTALRDDAFDVTADDLEGWIGRALDKPRVQHVKHNEVDDDHEDDDSIADAGNQHVDDLTDGIVGSGG